MFIGLHLFDIYFQGHVIINIYFLYITLFDFHAFCNFLNTFDDLKVIEKLLFKKLFIYF